MLILNTLKLRVVIKYHFSYLFYFVFDLFRIFHKKSMEMFFFAFLEERSLSSKKKSKILRITLLNQIFEKLVERYIIYLLKFKEM